MLSFGWSIDLKASTTGDLLFFAIARANPDSGS
jgi:hypothetical protein